MRTKTLKVLRVKPGRVAERIEIKDTVEALQKEVGGYFEAAYPFDDPVAIVCNEEGKFNGSEPNMPLRVGGLGGPVYDVIFGTVLLVGLGDEDFISLSDELMDKYEDILNAERCM